jgi:hypothetical protein
MCVDARSSWRLPHRGDIDPDRLGEHRTQRHDLVSVVEINAGRRRDAVDGDLLEAAFRIEETASTMPDRRPPAPAKGRG